MFRAKTFSLKIHVRKAFLQNFGLFCGSIIVFLLVAEGALRIIYPETSMIHKKYPQGVLCQRHPLFGWIGQPNASGVLSFDAKDMHDMHVLMNADGFWDTPHQSIKPPGVRRLLFLGDSFTSGYGIDKKERFTDLVKDRLSSEYEVINMGMWGYSTDQELLVFDEKGLAYAPDVVILSMFVDDLFCSNLFSVNDGMYIKPRFSVAANNNLELANVPVPDNHSGSLLLNMVLSRFYNLRNRLALGVEINRRGWFSVFDKRYYKLGEHNLTLRLLHEIYAIAKKHNMVFLLVFIPYKDQLYEGKIYDSGGEYVDIPPERLDLHLPQKVVKLFCEKTGIPMLDLLPVFNQHSFAEKLFFDSDLHWTREGHCLAAEQILAYLHKLNYLRRRPCVTGKTRPLKNFPLSETSKTDGYQSSGACK